MKYTPKFDIANAGLIAIAILVTVGFVPREPMRQALRDAVVANQISDSDAETFGSILIDGKF